MAGRHAAPDDLNVALYRLENIPRLFDVREDDTGYSVTMRKRINGEMVGAWVRDLVPGKATRITVNETYGHAFDMGGGGAHTYASACEHCGASAALCAMRAMCCEGASENDPHDKAVTRHLRRQGVVTLAQRLALLQR